jgi:adenine-specific DNA-methyltransferase
VIKYLGSKRLLIPKILEQVRLVQSARSVIDLFSGTSRVGYALKAAGYRVLANDHNAYAEMVARCYVETDVAQVSQDAGRLIRELNALPGRPGFFTETYCEKSRFFHPKNGARIDAIRNRITELGLPRQLEAVVLVALMEAADRVDSTTGVQMAYLKQWAPRALADLELRFPPLLERAPAGPGQATGWDALEAARRLEADVAYLDPPYNQHSYLANYHIWETLVLWDSPGVYGSACKRLDCRTRKSPLNSKVRFLEYFRSILSALRVPVVIVSFSDEGFLTEGEMALVLGDLAGPDGTVERAVMDYRRYVGARIGIYNPKGEKVGRVGRLRNREILYCVRRSRPSEEVRRA